MPDWPDAPRQVVVSEGAARLGSWEIGSTVNIYGTDFQVSGLVSTDENAFGSVWMTLAEGRQLFGTSRGFQVGYLTLVPSANPEKVSSICAVLAETDVINMVSRGIATPDILKGIHLSMASRIVKLLKVTGIKEGTALLTGGLALDGGLLAAISEEMTNEKVNVTALNHPDSIYAGAIGAALWGAFRHGKLKERGLLPKAS